MHGALEGERPRYKESNLLSIKNFILLFIATIYEAVPFFSLIFLNCIRSQDFLQDGFSSWWQTFDFRDKKAIFHKLFNSPMHFLKALISE